MRGYFDCFQFIAINILAVMLVFVAGCDQKKQSQQNPVTPVNVMKMASSEIPYTKEYIGTTESISEVGIRARVKGFLQRINFIEGNPVKKNQLLFVIDPNAFQAKVDLAEGDLVKAIADREFQRVEYIRMKKLVSQGNISKERYDRTSAQYKAAIGSVKSAEANLEEAKINLGYTSMYSPFDGLIGEKFVDVGNLVGGADETLLANVVQLNPIYILFNPSVDDYSEMLQYRKNMPFEVVATMPKNKNIQFKGRFDLINNLADVDTSTILMRALIKNPDHLILPGMYMNVKVILTKNKKVLLVPETAVINEQGQQTVLVVNNNSELKSRKIETSGDYQQHFIIKSGLKTGDVIVIDDVEKLKPGMKVKPMQRQHG